MKNNVEFNSAVKIVLENLDNNNIGPLSALQLWAAAMQACFVTMRLRKKFTIILSAKYMWFVELKIGNLGVQSIRQLRISDAVAVGSPGSNLKLLCFLHMARTIGDMAEVDQRMWEQAVSAHQSPAATAYKPDAKPQGASEDSGHAAQQESPERSNKKCKTDDEGSSGDLPSKQESVGHSTPFKGEDIGELILEKPGPEEYMSRYKYGVVPYFYQIKDVVGVLGAGRCGQVKKIKWKDGFAAMKEYMLDPHDDNRCNIDVFEHEREVLFELRSLWGDYVPAILFHKYWPIQPVLGIQVGEPMPHEWSDWSEDEVRQAYTAIHAVEQLGWNHGDLEARNFIRLTREDGSTSIAMIDFEDAYRVGETG